MRYRWFLCAGTIGLVLGLLLLIPAAQAQDGSGSRCFPETGECIAGPIRAYWEANGGLPVFGYPITPMQIETIDDWTGPTQWFERDRLEDHGAEGVLAGRLGARLLELQGRPWDVSFSPVSPGSVPPECRYFSETQHSLCDPFLTYWELNGGVERFGYPITQPFQETIGTGSDAWTGTVQYFERRRMELHPELPGSPILLGLLGQEILEGTIAPEQPALPTAPPVPGTPPPPAGPVPQCVAAVLDNSSPDTRLLRAAYELVSFREVMGCPVAYVPNRRAAVQRFERGEMLWFNLETSLTGAPRALYGRHLFGLFNPGPTYERHPDTWVADVDPYVYDLDPPRDGLYAPVGGFGKLWINDSSVRNRLGWATEELPTEGEAAVVIFDNIYNDPNNLGILVLFEETSTVYAFGRVDMVDEVQVVFP